MVGVSLSREPTPDTCPGQISWHYDRAEIIADGIVHAVGVCLGLIGAAFPNQEIQCCDAIPNYSCPVKSDRLLEGTLSGIRTGSSGAGSLGVGVGLGTTTGLGIISGISMGSEPG
jgi:hypothetical protein